MKNEKEEYYIRAGSSFQPTPHAVLAGLFGRAPHSLLTIEFFLKPPSTAGGPSPRLQLHFELKLRNDGRGLAKGLFVLIDTKNGPDCEFHCTYNTDRWQCWSAKTDEGKRVTAVARAEVPALPPGSSFGILEVYLERPKRPVSEDAVINIECGSESGPGSAYTATLPRDALNRAVGILSHDYRSQPEEENAIEQAQALIEPHL